MTRVRTVTTAKMARVLKALAGGGHDVARIELKPNGDVFIVPNTKATDVTDLDSWRQARDARKAEGS